jgi:biopolymer transport protein ExbD
VAGSSLYQDEDSGGAITDINVTPFVDILLVLLVVFMVTAKLIVARGVEIEKPKVTQNGELRTDVKLEIAVKQDGSLFINGVQFTDDKLAVAKIQEVAAQMETPKVIIAGDTRTAYGGVMHAINLAQDAKVTSIALENELR